MKKDLQAVSKNLKQLIRKTESIVKKLDRLEKTKPARKAKPKAVRKSKPKARAKVTKKSAIASPSGAILAIIKRSRKGVDVATLRNKAGIEGRKLNAIVHRLKKEGKIKSVRRGIYVKA